MFRTAYWYAARHIGGSYRTVGYSVDIATGAKTPYTSGSEWKPDVTHGIVTGGGVEFGRGRLRIAPELRYTRWNNDPIDLFGNHGYG
jgi:hypothetical protein